MKTVLKGTAFETVLQLKISMRFIRLFITLVILLTACSYSSSKSSNQNTQTIVSDTEAETPASSLCELFDNPKPYQQKVVRLKTTLFSSRAHTGIGDERCEQRHSLVDVDFSDGLETSVCKKENAEQSQLCALLSTTKNNTGDDTYYVVIADFIGYFEYYESKEGFTHNGLRFRFRINKIENIEKITPGKAQRAVP